jgi:hypothetical protein
VARALAVEIDVVPGGPAACGALIGVNFWACGFFNGGVVSFTYWGLISGGVPLGVGAGESSGVRIDGAAPPSSIAVGDAALSSSIAAGDVAVSSSIAAGDVAVSSRVGLSNSLALGGATIGSPVAIKVS